MTTKEVMFYHSGYAYTVTNPSNGEKYDFRSQVNFWQKSDSKLADGRVNLICWRNDVEYCILQSYQLEPMNHFSLFALANQYIELIENWISTSPNDHKVRTAQHCFAKGHGPIVKVTGKEVKSLGLQIVEVIE